MYHFSAQIIGRSAGRSAVAAAAYRSGEKVTDERTGLVHDYTRKQGVYHRVILLPPSAPRAFFSRYVLWNSVEKKETRKNSQTAREIDFALPIELSRKDQIRLARTFVREVFVKAGMCADLCLHDLHSGNPHAHVMLTTRNVSSDGFTTKNRDWNEKSLLMVWREKWADYANSFLEKRGFSTRLDHRSLLDQGITDRLPSVHLGPQRHAMQKKGIILHTLDLQQQQIEERARFAAQEKAEQARLAAIANVKRLIEEERAREDAALADAEAEAFNEAALLAEIEAEKTLARTIELGQRLKEIPQRRAAIKLTEEQQIEALSAPIRKLRQTERKAHDEVQKMNQRLEETKADNKVAYASLQTHLSERSYLTKILEKTGLRADKKRSQLQQAYLDTKEYVEKAQIEANSAAAAHSQAKTAWLSRANIDRPNRDAILKETADQLAALEEEEKLLHAELDALLPDEPLPVMPIDQATPPNHVAPREVQLDDWVDTGEEANDFHSDSDDFSRPRF